MRLLKNILNNAKIPCATVGTLNSSSFSPNSDGSTANFTTPDPEELYPQLQRISDAGIEYVIMETTSHALKLEKLAPINFEIGIFTNMGKDHIGPTEHADFEEYLSCKKELFKRCKVGVGNLDDPYYTDMFENAAYTKGENRDNISVFDPSKYLDDFDSDIPM
jgi:UDP-N-acetylmuramoyl-L-alanyl-D-glutamate--2,6-diaminopimelate ligase